MSGLTYAIGDVHGCLGLLERAHAWIAEDSAGHDASLLGPDWSSYHTVVHLGDYVDRGPESRAVLDLVLRGPTLTGHRWVVLRGNHEDLMVRALCGDDTALRVWLENGGEETLEDYRTSTLGSGIATYDREALRAHCDQIRAMPIYYEDAHRLFAHAGVRSRSAGRGSRWVTSETTAEDLLWVREQEMDEHWPQHLTKLVVHGHCPHPDGPVVLPHRVNIDTRAYTTRGQLTVARFDDSAPREPTFRGFSVRSAF